MTTPMNTLPALIQGREGLAALQKKVATSFDVDGEEALTIATESVAIASRLFKAAEAERKGRVAPLNAQVDAINAEYKPVTGPLAAIEKSLKDKVELYRMAERQRAREAEARAEAERRKAEQEARDREAERAKADKAANLEELPPLPADMFEQVATSAPVVQEPAKRIQSTTGGLTGTLKWKFKIVDPLKVPREYCVPDESLIRQLVKDGVRTIPGVEIYEGETLRNT